MIHDLDGSEPEPSRAGLVRAVSIVLVVGALAGWVAANSTAFQGPFATPHPSPAIVTTAVRLVSPPIDADGTGTVWIATAPDGSAFTIRCAVPGPQVAGWVVVGAQRVVLTRLVNLDARMTCEAPRALPIDFFSER